MAAELRDEKIQELKIKIEQARKSQISAHSDFLWWSIGSSIERLESELAELESK